MTWDIGGSEKERDNSIPPSNPVATGFDPPVGDLRCSPSPSFSRKKSPAVAGDSKVTGIGEELFLESGILVRIGGTLVGLERVARPGITAIEDVLTLALL